MELTIKNIEETSEEGMYLIQFYGLRVPKTQAQYIFNAAKIELQVTG